MNYEPPSIQESLASSGTADAAACRGRASKELSKGSPAPKPAQHRYFPASTPWDVYKMLSGFVCKAFLMACTLLELFAQ